MARLPIPGSDTGQWGTILNEFLLVEHNSDGSLKSSGALGDKAPLNNPTFSGSVTVPSPVNATDAVTKQYVDGLISAGAPDATAASKGILQLTGDLAGSATDPQIATGVITNAHVATTANIAQSKITNLTTDLANKADISTTINGQSLASNVILTPDHLDDTSTTHKFITASDISKLAGIAAGAQVNVNADWESGAGSSQILNKPSLASVATSGEYNDLAGRPTIPAAQVNSDWSASSGVGEILNKPLLGSAAAASVEDFAPSNQVVPGGGTTGQSLVKLSNDDYDAAWVNLASQSIEGTIFAVGDNIDPSGVGDSTLGLQETLDAAAGGVWVLPKGTYLTDPLDIPSGTTLHLQGVLTLRPQNVSGLPSKHAVLQAYGSSGNYLSNIHIIGQGGGVNGNRSNMTGSFGLDMEAVNFEYVEDSSIVGLRVTDAIDSGIDLDLSRRIFVSGNNVTGCGGWGIHLSNGSVDCRIIGNEVRDCGTPNSRGGIDQYAGSNPQANRNIYVGNRVADCYRNWHLAGAQAVWAGNASISSANPNILTANLSTLDPGRVSGGGSVLPEVSYIEDPTPELLRDALVSLGLMTMDAPALPLPVTAGLIGRWDANSLTGSGPLSTWPDISGTGNHATRGGSDNTKPSLVPAVQNGRSAVSFSGSGRALLLPDGTIPTGSGHYTIISAVATDSPGTRTIISQGSTGNANQAVMLRGVSTYAYAMAWWNNNLISDDNIVEPNAWHTVATTWDGSNRVIMVNGDIEAIDQPGAVKATNGTRARIGAATSGSNNEENYWSGYMGEILLFNRTLDSAEINSVVDYLNEKWGIAS